MHVNNTQTWHWVISHVLPKLLYLGREYPQGSKYFRERLKLAFMKNKDVADPEKIKQLVARGDFVIKELEALYFLRKYRAMKKRYYDPQESQKSTEWPVGHKSFWEMLSFLYLPHFKIQYWPVQTTFNKWNTFSTCSESSSIYFNSSLKWVFRSLLKTWYTALNYWKLFIYIVQSHCIFL